jgi:predicted DNA-binding transcriptional regulator YafY
MRASRLLSILILLQMRGRLSAEQLAAEFEVSVRTIYRDIDELSAAGVPVYAERGRSGGFALHEGYRTQLTGLTAAEAGALLLAGAPAADLGLGPDAAQAQLKLLASMPPEHGARASRVAQRFHLDPAGWYARPSPPAHLSTIAEAVWSGRRLRLEYESWKDVVAREVDPLGLVLKGGHWYLVAAVKGQPRTYRISNVRTVVLRDAPARRPRAFDLARYWQAWAADFEARLLSMRAVVKLSPEGLRLLRDLSPAAFEAAATSVPCRPAGWVRADIPLEGGDHGLRQLLQLGGEVEVLEPESLREALRAEAQKVAARHARRGA